VQQHTTEPLTMQLAYGHHGDFLGLHFSRNALPSPYCDISSCTAHSCHFCAKLQMRAYRNHATNCHHDLVNGIQVLCDPLMQSHANCQLQILVSSGSFTCCCPRPNHTTKSERPVCTYMLIKSDTDLLSHHWLFLSLDRLMCLHKHRPSNLPIVFVHPPALAQRSRTDQLTAH
jgi:hypothetical protein